MTLIVALKSDFGIVLAADKRTTNGGQSQGFNDTAIKAYQVNAQVAIAGAGSGGVSQEIITEISNSNHIDVKDVVEIKQILQEKIDTRRSAWYTNTNIAARNIGLYNFPDFGFLLAGYDSHHNTKIYQFTSSMPITEEITINYAQIGVPDVAEYFFHKKHDRSFTIRKMANLARFVIRETASFSSAISPTSTVIELPV